MGSQVHTFDNGVAVYDDHLVDGQRKRYQLHNVHEVEEEVIFTEWIGKIPPTGCFVSVGCAIGYYIILGKKLAPDLTVHAVEPLARHQGCTRDNMLLNDIDPESITLHTEGIATGTGTVTFQDDGFSSVVLTGDQSRPAKYWLKFAIKKALNALGVGDFGKEVSQISKIPTIPLAELLKRVGQRVDLLQMDVQGLEADILDAATADLKRGTIETLLIGTHSDAIHARCLRILSDAGYRILHDDPDPGTQPDGMIVATKREG